MPGARQRRSIRRRDRRERSARAARDPRVVASRGCGWWDSIAEAGQDPHTGLPCCPGCGALLYEWAALGEWQVVVTEYANEIGDERYPMFVEWMRGQCRPLAEARAEFDATIEALPKGTPGARSLVDKYRERLG